MTPEELAAIEARWQAQTWFDLHSRADVAALVAEVRRLQAEVKELRQEIKHIEREAGEELVRDYLKEHPPVPVKFEDDGITPVGDAVRSKIRSSKA